MNLVEDVDDVTTIPAGIMALRRALRCDNGPARSEDAAASTVQTVPVEAIPVEAVPVDAVPVEAIGVGSP